ncbi:hypothetical protein, partial [Escherichia coli]|uniref:hypothetical protein n=1 Tax=Escherichia coli TaxID=562 RepID=UPI00237A1D19
FGFYPLAIRHILLGIVQGDKQRVSFGIRHIETRLAEVDNSKSFVSILSKAAAYMADDANH